MIKALNNTELSRLETTRHIGETKANINCWPCNSPDHTFLEDFKKPDECESNYNDAMTRLYYNNKDTGLQRECVRMKIEWVKNKPDHLIALQEK